MPAFHVTAETLIDAPIERVHEIIGDFTTWPHWSPWLCLEPDAKIEYQGEAGTLNHGYQWEGQKVGAGNMVWVSLTPTALDANLEFLKPFKSKAKVGFKLQSDGPQTRVEWWMDSSLPFFLFFMVRTMKGMIRMDYARGLALLKDWVETGQIPASMHAEGVVDMPSVRYVGVDRSVGLDDIATDMDSAFTDLMQQMRESNLTEAGVPFAIYRKMDMVKNATDYTAALPVAKSESESVEGNLVQREIPAGKAYKVVHEGPYRHLGNAWSLAMSDIRHAKMKASKQHKPFERYMNDPGHTDDNDLVTEIYVPLR